MARILLIFAVLMVSCQCGGSAYHVNRYNNVRAHRAYPLRVFIDPAFPVEVHAAAPMVYAQFPCHILRGTGDINEADIVVELDKGQRHCQCKHVLGLKDGKAGSYMDCPTAPDTVILQDTPDLRAMPHVYVLLTHELGHAVGLDHDPETEDTVGVLVSIMEPGVLQHRIEIIGGNFSPRLMADDLHDLVNGYCR